MPPPKRMSDILASSTPTTHTQTSPPTSSPSPSDSPTLPLPLTNPATPATKKRKRTPPPPSQRPQTEDRENPDARKEINGTKRIHPALYEPWTLLPIKQRRVVEQKGTGGVKTVVFSKNQNVRAGVGRVVGILTPHDDGDDATHAGVVDGDKAHKNGRGSGGAVVAVSAQGAGTVKLVGIVEVVRRVLGQARGERVQRQAAGDEGGRWFAYTVLSSVVTPRDGRVGADEPQRDREHEHEHEDAAGNAHAHGDQTSTTHHPQSADETPTKRTPVLSIWFSRTRLQSFGDAFGEEQILV